MSTTPLYDRFCILLDDVDTHLSEEAEEQRQRGNDSTAAGREAQAFALKELMQLLKSIDLASAASGEAARVPEPTETMLVAGLKECEPLGELIDWREGFGRDDMRSTFNAMLAAAPKAPASAEVAPKPIPSGKDRYDDPLKAWLDEQHPDDAFVDSFAYEMKLKLLSARNKGRGGWQTCPPEELSRMLREHVEKGDPIDVANFAMFLFSLKSGITTQSPAPEHPQLPKMWTEEEVERGYVGIRWVSLEGVAGRPTTHDLREELERAVLVESRVCDCDDCKASQAAPEAASPSPAEGDEPQDLVERVMRSAETLALAVHFKQPKCAQDGISLKGQQ